MDSKGEEIKPPTPLMVCLAGCKHGCVDPGPAAAGRGPSPDASLVRPALPHRGAPLLIPVDREPALVSEPTLLHHIS